jgi:serine/threonine-protein kinase Chk1
VTTRFWLNIPPADAYELVRSYLATQLPDDCIQARGTYIRVAKPAGGRSVRGTLLFQESDTHAPSGQTLVSMRREKGSILHWRAFWWAVVRAPQLDGYIVRGDL